MEMRDKIKALRKRLNDITQGQLAEMVGVAQSTVSRWEKHGAIPDPEQLKSLAALAGQTVDEFLADESGGDVAAVAPADSVDAQDAPGQLNDVVIEDAAAQALYDRAKRTVIKILRKVGVTDAETISQLTAMHYHDLASGKD